MRTIRRFAIGIVAVSSVAAAYLGNTVSAKTKAPKEPVHRAAAAPAAAPNDDCTLIVPPDPLSARGLATPYEMVATDPDKGPCHESNAAQAGFVQAAILDPVSGQISIYAPLVVDHGTDPALAPLVPTLPDNAVVALWFGSNAKVQRLRAAGTTLNAASCVTGAGDSAFGQFAYCNAPTFFTAAHAAMAAGRLVPPPLGVGRDGRPCPTVRDFALVDQDQSDNVTTTYLLTREGRTAQMSRANLAALPRAQMATNGSDNRLLAVALDGALGCSPWVAPDLSNPGTTTSALPLNELHAERWQAAPVAVVPAQDPMVLVDGKTSLAKLNAYRAGVDQPSVTTVPPIHDYCASLLAVGPQRLSADQTLTAPRLSPDPAAATTLFTFLAQRFVTSYGGPLGTGLACDRVLGAADPVTVRTDKQGVAVDAAIGAPRPFHQVARSGPTPASSGEGDPSPSPRRTDDSDSTPSPAVALGGDPTPASSRRL